MAAQTSPSAAAALEGPGEPDELLTEPLALFNELHASRTSNGFGMNPISWVEIEAYGRVRGLALTGWEVALVRRMDAALMDAVAKRAGEQAPKG